MGNYSLHNTFHTLQGEGLEDGDQGSNVPPNLSKDQIHSYLISLNSHKSMGSSEMHPRVLTKLADVVAKTLIIFEKLLQSGVVTGDWKKGNFILIFMKGRKGTITSVPGKIMGQIHQETMLRHTDNREGL